MLYGRIFPLKLKGTAYMIYVRSVILEECEIVILRRTEMSMLRATCGVQLKEIHGESNVWSTAQR